LNFFFVPANHMLRIAMAGAKPCEAAGRLGRSGGMAIRNIAS
jgi:hypothetical protein